MEFFIIIIIINFMLSCDIFGIILCKTCTSFGGDRVFGIKVKKREFSVILFFNQIHDFCYEFLNVSIFCHHFARDEKVWILLHFH